MKSLYESKVDFVEGLLQPLVKAIDPSITAVEYAAEENKGRLYNELVLITFENSNVVEINVGADSNLAIARDVLRELQ